MKVYSHFYLINISGNFTMTEECQPFNMLFHVEWLVQ